MGDMLIDTGNGAPLEANVCTCLATRRVSEAVAARSGRDVVGKVWKLFLGQAPDAVFKLETLATAGDPSEIAKQAHLLKSMSLSAGAAQVAARCESIEQLCHDARLSEARDLLAGLRPELDAVCAEMNVQLARRNSA